MAVANIIPSSHGTARHDMAWHGYACGLVCVAFSSLCRVRVGTVYVRGYVGGCVRQWITNASHALVGQQWITNVVDHDNVMRLVTTHSHTRMLLHTSLVAWWKQQQQQQQHSSSSGIVVTVCPEELPYGIVVLWQSHYAA